MFFVFVIGIFVDTVIVVYIVIVLFLGSVLDKIMLLVLLLFSCYVVVAVFVDLRNLNLKAGSEKDEILLLLLVPET